MEAGLGIKQGGKLKSIFNYITGNFTKTQSEKMFNRYNLYFNKI